MAMRFLSSCWLAASLLDAVAAQITQPTNSTPQTWSNSQIGVSIAKQNEIPQAGYKLLPLTPHAVPALGNSAVTGPAIALSSSTYSNTVLATSIVFIQCDGTGVGANDPSQIYTSAAAVHPMDIIFYSTTSSFCNYTAGTYSGSYMTLWTLTNQTQGQWILDNLPNGLGATTYQARIYNVPDANSTSSSGSTSNNNNGSPSTAVAMIILYSITGVITALFLVIIVTGAIRAHRHPERYGPRNIMGRTRQSRARGLARAIVDTLPIVKFGEQEPAKPGAGDVEMASEGAATAAARNGENGALLNETRKSEEGHGALHASGAISAAPSPEPLDPKEEENPGCSICTDDFERGQDVRVLPCGHTFHPPCIDPWLLNVSGTCPLCRVDLRPASVHSNRTTTSNFLNYAESESGSRRGSFAAPLEEEGRDRRSRFSLFGGILNPERMERASAQERIAALRRVRDERNSVGDEEHDVRRRRRLTARLHDAFHVRTRARSASRSRAASPDGERPVSVVPDVPDMPQIPPEAHSVDHISHSPVIVPAPTEPPQLSPISPLQSPVSLTFPAASASPSRRPSQDASHTAAPSS